MDDRPYLVVAAGGHLETLRRRALFEQAHPEVTIVNPGGLNDRWRAIIPLGKIPAHPDETTIGAWLLADLMDQLDEIYPPSDDGNPDQVPA
jgi:hypothetical protein